MIMASAFHLSAGTECITSHIPEKCMMNLNRCSFGKNRLKSLDHHLSLGKAWQSGLLETRGPVRTASHLLKGRNRDNGISERGAHNWAMAAPNPTVTGLEEPSVQN